MDWLEKDVADAGGDRYAHVEEIFAGRTSGRPEFGIVSLLGATGEAERVVVPLTGARTAPDGTLVLAVSRERVLAAPRVRGEVDEIPAEAGRLVLEHFGVAEQEPGGADATVPTKHVHPGDDEPTEVVRHEEQLSVGTRATATERVRVRKRVVTEDVTLTVTLRREELVIDRERIDEGSARVAAPAEFPLAQDGGEVDFVLHAEEPVVTKRVVPVERVSLRRETTTEDRHVTDTVRKERVDVDRVPTTREEPNP